MLVNDPENKFCGLFHYHLAEKWWKIENPDIFRISEIYRDKFFIFLWSF